MDVSFEFLFSQKIVNYNFFTLPHFRKLKILLMLNFLTVGDKIVNI